MTTEERAREFLSKQGASPNMLRHTPEAVWLMSNFARSETAAKDDIIAELGKKVMQANACLSRSSGTQAIDVAADILNEAEAIYLAKADAATGTREDR